MKKEELQRDNCEKCKKLKEDGVINSLGQQIYCSQGHAQEEYYRKKGEMVKNLRKEIFDMIYQWGRVGIVVDENAPAIKELLDNLEQTYY